MPIIPPGKYIPWIRDEIIIVLSLYESLDIKKVPHKNILQEYSDLLNKNGYAYRSTSSVGIRIANFISLDESIKPNRKGLDGLSALVKEIWNEFSDNKIGLKQEAERIIASIVSGARRKNPIETDVEGNSVSEGRQRIIKEHKVRERNPTIVRRKKDSVKKQKGCLACEACGFDFAKHYGELGEDFIECHHKKPVAQMKIDSITSLDDLALLCSNCHRMIHRPANHEADSLTVERLKGIINSIKL